MFLIIYLINKRFTKDLLLSTQQSRTFTYYLFPLIVLEPNIYFKFNFMSLLLSSILISHFINVNFWTFEKFKSTFSKASFAFPAQYCRLKYFWHVNSRNNVLNSNTKRLTIVKIVIYTTLLYITNTRRDIGT